MSEAIFVNVYIENMKTALFDEISKHLITKSQLDVMEAKNKKVAE